MAIIAGLAGKGKERRIFWFGDLQTGKAQHVVDENGDFASIHIERIQISPDGKFVLYASGPEHKLIDLAEKKIRWKVRSKLEVLAFSPGGVFVAQSEKGALYLGAFEDMLNGVKKFKPKR